MSSTPVKMTLWAVVTPEGDPLLYTLRDEQFKAIHATFGYHEWGKMMSKGYDCRKFTVTFQEEEGC